MVRFCTIYITTHVHNWLSYIYTAEKYKEKHALIKSSTSSSSFTSTFFWSYIYEMVLFFSLDLFLTKNILFLFSYHFFFTHSLKKIFYVFAIYIYNRFLPILPRRCTVEILPIRRKTIFNQSSNTPFSTIKLF